MLILLQIMYELVLMLGADRVKEMATRINRLMFAI